MQDSRNPDRDLLHGLDLDARGDQLRAPASGHDANQGEEHANTRAEAHPEADLDGRYAGLRPASLRVYGRERQGRQCVVRERDLGRPGETAVLRDSGLTSVPCAASGHDLGAREDLPLSGSSHHV